MTDFDEIIRRMGNIAEAPEGHTNARLDLTGACVDMAWAIRQIATTLRDQQTYEMEMKERH